jgi:hypothetical protein
VKQKGKKIMNEASVKLLNGQKMHFTNRVISKLSLKDFKFKFQSLNYSKRRFSFKLYSTHPILRIDLGFSCRKENTFFFSATFFFN